MLTKKKHDPETRQDENNLADQVITGVPIGLAISQLSGSAVHNHQ